MEDHLDVGVLLGEQGQHIGQKGGAAPRGYADVEDRPLLVLQIPQVADQLPVQITLALQIGMEHLPCRRQLQGRVGTVQQHGPQIGLQLGQILAEVGLGQIQPLRRLGDAALLHYGQKVLRIFHKHSHAPHRGIGYPIIPRFPSAGKSGAGK